MYSIHVKHYEPDDLAFYGRTDALKKTLEATASPEDEKLGCHRWLLESMPKRMVYLDMYGEFLGGHTQQHVLDIGGGVTSLTRVVASNCNYTLIDLLAHDDRAAAEKTFKSAPVNFNEADWCSASVSQDFDVVVCNDLIPNVDQRLKLFLDKFLPVSKEIRLLVTYYNNDRFYKVKRVDADEIMFLQAWTGGQVALLLRDRFPRLANEHLEGFYRVSGSIYPNGRLTSLITITRD